MESVTLDEKKNKMKENEQNGSSGGGSLDKLRQRTLDFRKIEKVLPGLLNYREPEECVIREYLKSSDPLAF